MVLASWWQQCRIMKELELVCGTLPITHITGHTTTVLIRTTPNTMPRTTMPTRKPDTSLGGLSTVWARTLIPIFIPHTKAGVATINYLQKFVSLARTIDSTGSWDCIMKIHQIGGRHRSRFQLVQMLTVM